MLAAGGRSVPKPARIANPAAAGVRKLRRPLRPPVLKFGLEFAVDRLSADCPQAARILCVAVACIEKPPLNGIGESRTMRIPAEVVPPVANIGRESDEVSKPEPVTGAKGINNELSTALPKQPWPSP
jgi:hypothetical protein